MNSHGKIFAEAEADANLYAARCLLIASGLSIIIWILNLVGFFIVDATIMNTAMPLCIILQCSPAVLLKCFHLQRWWMKYYICICFVVGVSILHIGMTYQAILAWACPVILSCHFFHPKVTKVTYIVSLILLLVTMFMGILYGTWDCNMLDSIRIEGDASQRWLYLLQQQRTGEDTLINVIKLYYVSRALLLTMVYIIGTNLSKRTYRLVGKQQAYFLEKERIGADLSVAAKIQTSMIPDGSFPYPDRSEFDLYATTAPCTEVSGDFYDFFFVDDDHLALVIADVSGSGVPAAMFMMSTMIMLQNAASTSKLPNQIITDVDKQLRLTNKNNTLVSIWFGIYEISTGKLVSANAGHECPILQKNGQHFELIQDKVGIPICDARDIPCQNVETHLAQGDVLFLYTDGIVNAVDTLGNAYGTDRLLAQLNKTAGNPLDVMLRSVKDDVDLFAKEMPQRDDMTMLCICKNQS